MHPLASSVLGPIVATLALGCACAAEARDFSASIVRVRALAADGAPRLGSGVAIGPDAVATACHVTRGAARVEVVANGSRWDVQHQTGSGHHDLCVLHVSGLAVARAVTRSSRSLTAGEAVVAVGFEGGEAPVVMQGDVAGLYRYDGGDVIRTGAPFDFGSSGGGLFDADGRLVGILAFRARSGERLRFALPSEWLSNAVVTSHPMTIGASAYLPAFWERSRDERPAFLGVALQEVAGTARR